MNEPLSSNENSRYDDNVFESQKVQHAPTKLECGHMKGSLSWKIDNKMAYAYETTWRTYTCEEFCVNSPWGLKASCKII